MRTLHQTLKLQHHRHTGRVLHHQHTSYRALAVVFIVAGLFIVGLNMASRAAADDFGVTGTVEAPVPTTPPVITTPTADAKLSGSSVLVFGSCPLVTPQVVVSVNVDGTPAGTGACDSRNDFSVPVTLNSGSHQITANALTITGQTGPTSSPISVSAATGSAASSVAITADQPFIYAAGKNITWTGSIGDDAGANEYVHLDWGDNSQSNYTVKAGPQSFSHQYTAPGPHNILLAVSDSSGSTGSEQFAAANFTTYSPAALVASTDTTSPLNTPTAVGLYGIYLTALSVTSIIWVEAKHAARQHARLHPA